MQTRNPYDVLGLDRDATQDDIKKAYRELANKYHPDREGGDQAKFREVETAYVFLSNEEQRKRFDSSGCMRDAPDLKEVLSAMAEQIAQEAEAFESDPEVLIKQSIYGGFARGGDLIQKVRTKVLELLHNHKKDRTNSERKLKRWRVAVNRFREQNAEAVGTDKFNMVVEAFERRIDRCVTDISNSQYKIEFGEMAIKQLEGLRLSDVFREDSSKRDLGSFTSYNITSNLG